MSLSNASDWVWTLVIIVSMLLIKAHDTSNCKRSPSSYHPRLQRSDLMPDRKPSLNSPTEAFEKCPGIIGI